MFEKGRWMREWMMKGDKVDIFMTDYLTNLNRH